MSGREDDAGLDPGTAAAERERLARRRLARVVSSLRGAREVVVGPWHSEVGFEVLYWIPFLRRLLAEHGVERARVTAISRGGVEAWYAPLAGRYVELYDLVPPQELLARKARRGGGQKQDAPSALDDELVRAAVGRLRAARAVVLHPSLVYGLLGRFWKGGLPLAEVLRRLRHERWSAPRHPVLEGLPERYVAARFYFSDPFPATRANRLLVRDALRSLAAGGDVVLLHTGLELDDHAEAEPGGGGEILRPLAGIAAGDNLRAQSAILAGADAFVGTYGGFSYLAAMLGTPSVALASHPERFFPTHLDVARRASAAAGAPFALLDTASLDLLAPLAPAA